MHGAVSTGVTLVRGVSRGGVGVGEREHNASRGERVGARGVGIPCPRHHREQLRGAVCWGEKVLKIYSLKNQKRRPDRQQKE